MRNRTRTAWIFLAPTLVLMALVAGWPLSRAIWYSFTETSINDLSSSQFIGLGNYFGEFGLFANPNYTDGFWHSDWGIAIRNTFLFAVVSVALETLAGLGLAMLLNQDFKGRMLARTAMLIPWAIPTIVSAKMWGWMLHDQYGLINQLLVDWGVISQKIAWTADPAYSLWTVVAVDVWKTTPFMALLILAALQTLPRDCYEAARVDGVHPLRMFIKVTLPLIKYPLLVAMIFRLLDALRIFDLIYVLTSNSSSTISMSGFVRREMIENGNLGFGSAASTSLTVIIFLTAVLFMRAARLKLSEEIVVKNRFSLPSIAIYLLTALVIVVCVYPFLYTIATSFKTGTALFDTSLLPGNPTWRNYVQLFEGRQPFGRHLLNSAMVASLTVGLALLLAITAAYALGRVQFRGKAALLLAILGISMFPQVAVLSGMFELLQALGLYNKAIGLVVPYTIFTLPFTVWVLTTFMRGLPKELEEAAIMDGCGPLRIIFEVFMPLLWPALVSTGLLAFIHAWNEFLFALTFVSDTNQRTVPVSISLISGADAFEVPWGSIMAASVIVTVPLVVLVLLFQRKIVSGLTAGAVKG